MHNDAFILSLRPHWHYFFWWSIASVINYIPLSFLSYLCVRAVVLLFVDFSESSRMSWVRILLWQTHSMSIAVKLFSPLTCASKVIFLNMLLVLFSEYCWHNSSPSLFPLHYQEANVHLYYIFSEFSLSFFSLTKFKVFPLCWCPTVIQYVRSFFPLALVTLTELLRLVGSCLPSALSD